VSICLRTIEIRRNTQRRLRNTYLGAPRSHRVEKRSAQYASHFGSERFILVLSLKPVSERENQKISKTEWKSKDGL